MIVLCYRAGDSIVPLLLALEESLREHGVDYELILVANYWPGAEDSTPSVVFNYATHRRDVTVISSSKEGGMGWDMRAGLAGATGTTMIAMDGDSQNPATDVVSLYELMRRSGADVGKGRRVERQDGIRRRIISAGYNAIFRLLFSSRGLWDINGKPKGITRPAYQAMRLLSDDWFIDAEIILEAERLGLQVVELPVVFHRNDERASFVRPSAIWEFAVHMTRYRLRGSP